MSKIIIDNDEQGAEFHFEDAGNSAFKVDIVGSADARTLRVEPKADGEYTIEFDNQEHVWVSVDKNRLHVKVSQYNNEVNGFNIYPFDVF